MHSSEGKRSKINLVAKPVSNEGPSLSFYLDGHLLTLTSHSGRQGDKLSFHIRKLILLY